MVQSDASTAAHELLYRTWLEGGVIDELPETMRPETRAEGYAIQALVESKSAKPLYGWKIAATSTAGQKHINVDGPLAGRILAERAFVSGATLLFGANRMRVAEPEFAFKMARDLKPRRDAYTVEEVLAAVASLHPAIEIPDSRYAVFTKVGAAQLIADNACAHEFVLGPATTADWRSLDLTQHRVVGRVGTRIEREGKGANVLDDPRLALTWLANELSGLGITLAKGQVVTTGTCMIPLEIEPGDHVSTDFGAIGWVELTVG
ncbi:MAG: hydratase [Hyphomicrobiaceae bacterium]